MIVCVTSSSFYICCKCLWGIVDAVCVRCEPSSRAKERWRRMGNENRLEGLDEHDWRVGNCARKRGPCAAIADGTCCGSTPHTLLQAPLSSRLPARNHLACQSTFGSQTIQSSQRNRRVALKNGCPALEQVKQSSASRSLRP